MACVAIFLAMLPASARRAVGFWIESGCVERAAAAALSSDGSGSMGSCGRKACAAAQPSQYFFAPTNASTCALL